MSNLEQATILMLKDGAVVPYTGERNTEYEQVVDNFGTLVNELSDIPYVVYQAGQKRAEKEPLCLLEQVKQNHLAYKRGQEACVDITIPSYALLSIVGYAEPFCVEIVKISQRSITSLNSGKVTTFPLCRVNSCIALSKQQYNNKCNEMLFEKFKRQFAHPILKENTVLIFKCVKTEKLCSGNFTVDKIYYVQGSTDEGKELTIRNDHGSNTPMGVAIRYFRTDYPTTLFQMEGYTFELVGREKIHGNFNTRTGELEPESVVPPEQVMQYEFMLWKQRNGYIVFEELQQYQKQFEQERSWIKQKYEQDSMIERANSF